MLASCQGSKGWNRFQAQICHEWSSWKNGMVSKLATTLLYICMYVCMPYLSRISIAESSCNVPANCHFCCDMNSLIKKNFLLIWCSQAENQKKYAEFDSRFKSSQVLKDLLEKSKQNKLKYPNFR
ncbi:Os03g0210700 [Oryza sativa Japonica Group]|uniref:Expressed protein n=2 Tax=Oryza sativa subsp. japonica TaxID=39947 RepID=Q10Q40_ORYSJ|nr:expressed protein [Oryza sativa Japonica Group]BAF11257.1 Os03g0210700 [Oryza sativa Japonica Group]BAG94138.1 unnamed protein product [Oryza sativa Japonica Group]|eukprot:NP_001049343.1 Os03g0210700 [Oryza sativa Japonica Group]